MWCSARTVYTFASHLDYRGSDFITIQNKKLIICGTGRAGTTLLMRILTTAGMDTGISKDEMAAAMTNIGRAGLEVDTFSTRFENLPQVIKSPWLVDSLPHILSEKLFEIGLALIPIRSLDAAAASRIAVHQRAIAAGEDPQTSPGGLWKTNDPARQEAVLAEQFYRTVEPLVAHGVPIQFTSFPLFAQNIDYFEETVAAPLEKAMGFDRAAILRGHNAECRTELITITGQPHKNTLQSAHMGEQNGTTSGNKIRDVPAHTSQDGQQEVSPKITLKRSLGKLVHLFRTMR